MRPFQWRRLAMAFALIGLHSLQAAAAPLAYEIAVQWDSGTPAVASFAGTFVSDGVTGELSHLNGVLVDAAGTFVLLYQFGMTQYGLSGLPDGSGGTYDYAFSNPTFDKAVMIDVVEPDPTQTTLANTAFYLSYFDLALGLPSGDPSWTSINASSVMVTDVTPSIPEPATAWLALAGLATVIWTRRRRTAAE